MRKINSESKSSILQASYCLFLKENYEKVTVREIEKQTKLTRGAIFYYFKDKQELFESIVKDIYLAEIVQYSTPIPSSCDVLDFLSHEYKSPCDRLISQIESLNLNINPTKAFFHFTLQASIYYPNFDIIYSDIMHDENIFIEKMLSNLTNSISKNDLKNIAHLLLNYSYGSTFNSILSISSIKIPILHYLKLQI